MASIYVGIEPKARNAEDIITIRVQGLYPSKRIDQVVAEFRENIRACLRDNPKLIEQNWG